MFMSYKIYIVYLFLLLLTSCTLKPKEEKRQEASHITRLEAFIPDETWTYYEQDAGAYSLAIPDFLELRVDSQLYTKYTQEIGVSLYDGAVFQQKGLGEMDSTSLSHYSRILIDYNKLSSTENFYLRATETEEITFSSKWYSIIYGDVDENTMNSDLLLSPPIQYQWISLADSTKAIEVKYRRLGGYETTSTTACTMYYLFNNDEKVQIIVSCRESESEYWKEALSHVIQTFKWATIK